MCLCPALWEWFFLRRLAKAGKTMTVLWWQTHKSQHKVLRPSLILILGDAFMQQNTNNSTAKKRNSLKFHVQWKSPRGLSTQTLNETACDSCEHPRNRLGQHRSHDARTNRKLYNVQCSIGSEAWNHIVACCKMEVQIVDRMEQQHKSVMNKANSLITVIRNREVQTWSSIQ